MHDVSNADILKESAEWCPVHHARDCSPLLNGCNRPSQQLAALARMEADAEKGYGLIKTERDHLKEECDIGRRRNRTMEETIAHLKDQLATLQRVVHHHNDIDTLVRVYDGILPSQFDDFFEIERREEVGQALALALQEAGANGLRLAEENERLRAFLDWYKTVYVPTPEGNE